MKSKKLIIIELSIIVTIATVAAIGLPLYRKYRLQKIFYNGIVQVEDDIQRGNLAVLYYERGYISLDQKDELLIKK